MIENIPYRKEFSYKLLSKPNNFKISYEINPYMNKNSKIENYEDDWCSIVKELRKYTKIKTVNYKNYNIKELDITQYPDIVFAANHGLGIPGTNKIILSNMNNKQRVNEIKYFKMWCDNQGYNTLEINDKYKFEGEGDGIWHPKRDLLWLGYGFRSDYGAIEEIDTIIESKTISLELTDERYYHLDVCFTPLSETDVLIIPDAFTSDSLDKIVDIFENVYYVPKSEKNTFACNSKMISKNTVAIDKINSKTIKLLNKKGYNVLEVDTKEFRKAGGSIDCLTLEIP